ncbi:MAG: glycosyltransferase family 2 protein [Deltaproteobacteria bacterium]|nr:glycosyltransferase family 2 protein [Deltaproteobacteria bacterium]
MERPAISVVVPAYGCESCLVPLYDALRSALESISPDFEIVIVEDHSPEGDWAVIVSLAEKDPRVRGVKLTRNFGQHNAIAAGLNVAEGDWVVVMDCDLQDGPEEITKLYAKAQEGFECVFGRRVDRLDSTGTVVSSQAFSWVHGKIGGFKPDAAVGNFSIVSRRVVHALREFREEHRNYAMQVHWLGFPTAYVPVVHAARHSGKSRYSFASRLRHAAATILSQSTRPLYASAAFGLLMALGAAITGIYLLVRKLTVGYGVEGWTSVMVTLWFLFGMLFLNMGVLGLYLGSVFNSVKNRPPFVIEKTTYESERDG